MRPTKILATVGSFLFVTGIMFAPAAAEAFAADGDTGLLAGLPRVHQDAPLLRYLFTWPDDQGNTANEAEENEEPLESDRPDFTDSPATVGLGRLANRERLYVHPGRRRRSHP